MHPFYLSDTRPCLCNALHFRLVCAQRSYCLSDPEWVFWGGYWVFSTMGGEPFSVIAFLAPAVVSPQPPEGAEGGQGCAGWWVSPQPPQQGRVSPRAGRQWSEAQLRELAEGKAESCSPIPLLTLCFQLNAQRKLSQLSAQRCGYKSNNLLKDLWLSLFFPLFIREKVITNPCMLSPSFTGGQAEFSPVLGMTSGESPPQRIPFNRV